MIDIIVSIDEDYYKILKDDVEKGMDYLPCVLIAKGIPLPKNHGDLKDYSQLDDHIWKLNSNGYEITRYEYKLIDNVMFEMPTIIKGQGGK